MVASVRTDEQQQPSESSPQIRVLALVPNLLGFAPGQRSSIEAWIPILSDAGVHVNFSPFESEDLHSVIYERGHYVSKATEMFKSYARRIQEVPRGARNHDAVLIYREAALIGPAVIERLINKLNVPIIYQLDDPLYVPYRSQFNSYLSYLKFFGKIKHICRLANVVIVNSTPIREFASQYNNNVWQIPSLVDTSRYTPVAKPDSREPVCVGWSGSPSTAVNLSVVAEPLRQLKARVDHRLFFIGSTDIDLPGIDFTAKPWEARTEVEDLQRLDIGLVPLPVNEWNQRKFFMKIAQYMALGIPPVSTPMGSALEDIDHGVNGFLAATDDQWVDHLETLVRDHALRRTMSENALRTARERFSVEANAPKIVDAFRSATRT